jgi:pyruvate dehydrogenase E2 component (dihydrolipoamide acetyltransferase)
LVEGSSPRSRQYTAIISRGSKREITPVAQRFAHEIGIDIERIRGTGKGARVTKEDIERFAVQSRSIIADQPKRILASPRAKRLAKEKGISLDEVDGSGPEGRIIERDILDFLGSDQILVPSRIERITAERTLESFSSAPHFYLRVEVNASKLLECRERLVPVLEREHGCHLTVTDLLLSLVGKTIVNHARVNAMWDRGRIRTFSDINIGLAVAVEEGLTVPVIRNVNKKTLVQIAQERSVLSNKAAEGRLSIEELEGGTFTLTNLGMFGVDEFDAIINPPQSAILAVGRIAERVIVKTGEMVIRPTMRLTLSIDHRVLDGAIAARFLTELKDLIEGPRDAFLSELTGSGYSE